LHIAASSRTSAAGSRSTIAAVSITIDSQANVSVARRASLSAMAACRPMAAPHCSRVRDHSVAYPRQRFIRPAQAAGIVSRPVFSVVSATFRPRPSPPRIALRGSRTSVKRMTPL
jgi:hypothetical protein